MMILEGPAEKVSELRFPLDPLIEFVTGGLPLCAGNSCQECPRCFSVLRVADRLQVPRDRLSKWIERGRLTIDAADAAATACGVHPVNVWPDWYDRQADLGDDLAVAS